MAELRIKYQLPNGNPIDEAIFTEDAEMIRILTGFIAHNNMNAAPGSLDPNATPKQKTRWVLRQIGKFVKGNADLGDVMAAGRAAQAAREAELAAKDWGDTPPPSPTVQRQSRT